MKPVEPEELSAFLDGELDPGRASEVGKQLADDPALRAEFEALEGWDAVWRTAAATGVFAPDVRLPTEASPITQGACFAILAASLVLLRMGPKLADAPTLGIGLNALVLATVLAGIIWFVQRDMQRPVRAA